MATASFSRGLPKPKTVPGGQPDLRVKKHHEAADEAPEIGESEPKL